MTAFGPFAGTVAVDFGPLAEAGLFVITGPTGAGKTSLLDGISYALYGRVPGGRRADKLRSDHAPPDRATAVVLEFALAGEDWRVTRSPQHQRPKQRGTGTTTQKPTASLLRRVRGSDWEAVCSGVEEVSTTITQSLGLDAEQFAQVVVLPQGEVQRALQADAKDRERLLSSLFSTGRFSAVTARLAERARRLEDEVARGAERLDGVHAEVALRRREIAKELADLPAAPPLAGAGAGDPDPGDARAPDATQDEVDPVAAVAEAEAAVALVEAVTRAARERAAAAAAALRDGELLADRVRRRRAAEADAARLAAAAQDVAADRARVAAATAAAPCRSALEADRDTAAGLAGARRAWSAAVGPLAALAGPVAPLDPELAATVTAWSAQDPPGPDEVDAARRALAGARGRLDQLLLRVASARRARAEAAAHDTRAARLEADADRADADGAAALADLDGLRAALEEARAAGVRLPAEEAEAARLRRLANAAADVLLLEDAWRASREAAVAATEAAQGAEAVHLDLWRRRLEGMAGVLAEHLEEGGPCPVCGATDHPDRADLFDGVTEDAIAEAERDAEAARREADAAAADRERAFGDLSTARSLAGDAAADPAAADAAADAAEAAARRTAALAARAADLAERLADRQADAARLADRAAAARREAAGELAGARACRRRAEDDEHQLAGAVGPGVDPRAAAGSADAVGRQLARLAAAAAAADRAAAERAGAAARLAALVTEQGFTDVAEVRAALLPPERLATLRSRVKHHDAEAVRVRATLADPDLAALAGTAEPDLDGLRAAAGEHAAAADETLERRAAVVRATAELRTLAAAAAERAAALAPLTGEARRVRHLADVCGGTGNALRMSLERFVLAAVLEDITARASVRLAAMSGGRYTLRHSDGRVRGNAASGLSILVRDAFTGVEREVGSLSGGETFQASLALALAVADAVQSHAGGVTLDTLFIDEGFGSLDPESLELAMDELDRLREGGRMVGVISHVAALAERVPVGLRVSRGRDGSQVDLVVGPDEARPGPRDMD